MNPSPIEILLVEDNPGDVELIKEGLRNGKIVNSLYVVSDGEQALDYLGKQGKFADAPTPDLVLLDINLPRINGHEVLEFIRSNPALARIPVVILTSSSADTDILKSYMGHANAFVSKPIAANEFINAVQSIKDFWLALVKLPPHADK